MDRLAVILGCFAVLICLAGVAVPVLSAIGASRIRRLYEQEKKLLLQRGRASPAA